MLARSICRFSSFRSIGRLLFLTVLVLVGCPVLGQPIVVTGSTIPVPVYSAWGAVYEKQSGTRVVYEATGTTAALGWLASGSSYLAVANRPLPESTVNSEKLVQFPMLSGGVVPVVNITGVARGQLKLTGPILADIYLGKITRWTDAAIAALNPRVRLPAGPITVVYRLDSSSTTFMLTEYLQQVSPDWRAKVGMGSAVRFPIGVAAKGMNNMLAALQELPNSIGYFHYSVVNRLQLAHVAMQNKAGNFTEPTYHAIQAAAQGYAWTGAMSHSTVNSSHPDAWPMASPSFVIMRTNFKSSRDAANGLRALDFLSWALRHGDQTADDQQFVPLPPDVKAQVEREVGVRLTELTSTR